mmetsp:Transcript_31864/g.59936  ORF Transcript_31864/g.59936 Transcript_31864/m.59936 type:complete len:783 (+) Transcript_31864:81-2429(+)
MSRANEFAAARGLLWIDMLMGITSFAYFFHQYRRYGRCKFEVLYVTSMGAFMDLMNVLALDEPPFMFHVQENGNPFNWARWFGWLSTCPVLLIHLSNLAGREVFDTRRQMFLLITYQLMMVCGMTASMADANSFEKIFFLFLGWFFITAFIFRYAVQIFREAVVTMPLKGKNHIYRMAAVFIISWSGFGLFFALGPEGMNWVSLRVTQAGYAAMDILAKPVFAWHGWHLRWNILRKHDNPLEFVSSNPKTGYGPKDKSQHRPDVYRILLIEKDEVFAYFFYNILFYQQNCEVQRAKTPAEAILKLGATQNSATKKSEEYLYDMIMVNYDMAEKNGYALVKDIRKKDKDGSVPVICYGRNIPEEAMYTKEKGGIDDWLLPPFPDVDIQNKMRKWIRRMANQRPSEPEPPVRRGPSIGQRTDIDDGLDTPDRIRNFKPTSGSLACATSSRTLTESNARREGPTNRHSIESVMEDSPSEGIERQWDMESSGGKFVRLDRNSPRTSQIEIEWPEPSEPVAVNRRPPRLSMKLDRKEDEIQSVSSLYKGMESAKRLVAVAPPPQPQPQPQSTNFSAASSASMDSLNNQVEKLIQQLEEVKRTSAFIAPAVSPTPSVAAPRLPMENQSPDEDPIVYRQRSITLQHWTQPTEDNLQAQALPDNRHNSVPSQAVLDPEEYTLDVLDSGDSPPRSEGHGSLHSNSAVDLSRARLLAKYSNLSNSQPGPSPARSSTHEDVRLFNPVFTQAARGQGSSSSGRPPPTRNWDDVNSNLLTNLGVSQSEKNFRTWS